eukprot:NODE_995_length_2660_cov_6.249507.p1 GENE.NODE_995_length_2660_cov_6.249507~~NODE_995_length_2660_cov_6.249507.p1  ORF type:complete len:530 (-),score=128.18 NODE_995_length_2660_cov_6.249507:530-2119(-)
MKLKFIAARYLGSWFFFDLSMLIPQILFVILNKSDQNTTVAILRYLRYFRALHLLRVLRLGKLGERIRSVSISNVEWFLTAGNVIKTVFFLLFISHLCACAWFSLGTLASDGWVEVAVADDLTMLQQYCISLHWAISQLGGSNYSRPSTGLEMFLDVFWLYLGLVSFALLVGRVVHMEFMFSNSDTLEFQRVCSTYLDRYEISRDVSVAMRHYTRAHCKQRDIAMQIKEENNLLKQLPESLREDLHMESRGTILKHQSLLRIISEYSPRIIRASCSRVTEEVVVVAGTVVFEVGECGTCMFLMASGVMWYDWCSHPIQPKPNRVKNNRRLRCVSVEDFASHPAWAQERVEVMKGQAVSEAVMWTKWEHVGELTVISDCRLLTLEPDTAAHVMSSFETNIGACALAYARRFIRHLNDKGAKITDVPDFAMNITEDDFDCSSGCMFEDHLVFLSHFKQEAGTEATLMKEALERMIKQGPAFEEARNLEVAIFLDSDNLEDLSTLRAHVTKSSNLIVLLTPNMLSRPWCLVV